MTTPTVSSSRLSAMPITPFGNSRSSDASAPSSPYTWAMPSPTSTTVPTERISTPASNWSIADLMMLVISSALIAIRFSDLSGLVAEAAAGDAPAQTLEPPADAAVEQHVADAALDAAEQL